MPTRNLGRLPEFSYHQLLRLLQFSAAGVFLGRAWQHWYWDAPYRALLWDERWMRRPVEILLKTDWGTYVGQTDAGIQVFIQFVGVFYLICGLAALSIERFPRIGRPLLLTGGAALLLLAFLYTKEKFFLLPQFFEYALQFGSPFFLLVFYRQKGVVGPSYRFWMKVAIALTFTCHGLFALGWVPTPGYFVEMVMNITGLDQSQSLAFLKVAGILDTVLSVMLFLPWRWSVLSALAYAVFWGLATTAARVWSYSYVMGWDDLLLRWLHESIMRLPHFLVPLFLLLLLWKEWRREHKSSRYFD